RLRSVRLELDESQDEEELAAMEPPVARQADEDGSVVHFQLLRWDDYARMELAYDADELRVLEESVTLGSERRHRNAAALVRTVLDVSRLMAGLHTTPVRGQEQQPQAQDE